MPPPEPRSSTVSPGCNWATATGLPQPRLARTAPSGSSLVSSYPAAPKHPASNAMPEYQQGGLSGRAADQQAEAGQGVGAGPVVDPHAALLPLQQPGFVQHFQVVAD